jgi:transposase InsO family protein
MRKSGLCIAEKVVRRLMKDETLVAFSSRKKRNYSFYYGEISPPVESIIKRNFQADKPNKKWLTDITEFRMAVGKVYFLQLLIVWVC